jgi:hypothetical protein
MNQLRLFPPPGSIPAPLPKEGLDEARELLAEMLLVVVDGNQHERLLMREGETDE